MCRDKLAANHTAGDQRELAQPAPGFHTSPSGPSQPRLSTRGEPEGRRERPRSAPGGMLGASASSVSTCWPACPCPRVAGGSGQLMQDTSTRVINIKVILGTLESRNEQKRKKKS